MEEYAYVLDYLAQGSSGGGSFRGKEPVCFALGDEEFKLFELAPKPGAAINIGDRVYIGKDASLRTVIDHVKRRIGPSELTHGAVAELEYCVTSIVTANQARFVRFFNEAGPISMRKHLLEELPGLGKKTMESILKDRTANGHFADLADLAARTGVKAPEKLLASRIVLEITDNGQKRYLFVSK